MQNSNLTPTGRVIRFAFANLRTHQVLARPKNNCGFPQLCWRKRQHWTPQTLTRPIEISDGWGIRKGVNG